MQLSSKDKQILYHILKYCDEVDLAIKEYGKDKDIFKLNPVFRNACAMPMMQIGELAKKLSQETIECANDIPWKAIKGMRDLFAHDYHSMNHDMMWTTSVKNIPELANNIKLLLGRVD